MIGRVVYAGLFAVALPWLLVAWAARMDALLSLPAYGSPALGWPLAAAGIALMVLATRDLWVFGGGMPASAYPPQRFVTRGTYGIVAHPIYVGAILVAGGVSLATRSAGGLWLGTPTLALAITAWVMGYERGATLARFGEMPAPLVSMPSDTAERPTISDHFSFYLLVLLPWFIAYEAMELLGAARDGWTMFVAWDAARLMAGTEVVYFAAYPVVLLASIIAPSRRALRALALDGLWATALIIPLYLLLPFPAFPASPVVWTALGASAFARRWPRARWPCIALAAAVAVSCVTTGRHGVADVVAGLACSLIAVRRWVIWTALQRGAERIANSWRETEIGPVRLLSHGLYTGAGAAIGVGVAAVLAGGQHLWWLVAMTAAAIVGAGLWAQLIEGSPLLLRPFGYFGSVVATVLFALAAARADVDGWLLFGAFGVGTTFAQAVGRLRCLVQGCCHGREAPEALGIRYRHPRSRVVRLAALGGVALHPTPLYSAIWMLFVGGVLLRLWSIGAPLSFIAGTYFLVTGAGRFVEEHYRGEPQTRVVGGLRLYQWLAIAFVASGPLLMSLASAPAPAFHQFDPLTLPVLLAVAAVTYAFYGLDFPRSNRRFSRLA